MPTYFMPDRQQGLLASAPDVETTNPLILDYLQNYQALEDHFQTPFIDSFTIDDAEAGAIETATAPVEETQNYRSTQVDDGGYDSTDYYDSYYGGNGGYLSAPAASNVSQQSSYSSPAPSYHVSDNGALTNFGGFAKGAMTQGPMGTAGRVISDPDVAMQTKVAAGIMAAVANGLSGPFGMLGGGLNGMGAYHDINDNPETGLDTLSMTEAGTLMGNSAEDSRGLGGLWTQNGALNNYNSLVTAPPGTTVNYAPYGLGVIDASLAAQDLGMQFGSMGGWNNGSFNPTTGIWNYGPGFNEGGIAGSLANLGDLGLSFGRGPMGFYDEDGPTGNIGWGNYDRGWVYDPDNPDVPLGLHRSVNPNDDPSNWTFDGNDDGDGGGSVGGMDSGDAGDAAGHEGGDGTGGAGEGGSAGAEGDDGWGDV